MIELHGDSLCFSFPEVHAHARLQVTFQRTLRIPDDDRTYPLPPGLGAFPLRHVDDYAERLPEAWVRHGGVMLPMFQAEALWIDFESPRDYPFAVKIAAGKINAVSGQPWTHELRRSPQDYVVVPDQPWLDGFCVAKGVIRQFVAMPLGQGYSVGEQLTGSAEYGGLQILAVPLKAKCYELARREREESTVLCSMSPAHSMGLAPGGRMRQEIYPDEHAPGDWEALRASRCFVHLANSLVWRAVTGEGPPTIPPTARQYSEAGLPWFEYYGEGDALEGAASLAGAASVAALGAKKGESPLPENEPATPRKVHGLGPPRRVREAPHETPSAPGPRVTASASREEGTEPPMDASRTYINFLLDRTGSMQAIKDATIEAFNGFVTNQSAQPGETFWTLTIFDSESIDRLYDALPGAQVPKLTPETYVPRASTPLLDAIGKTTHAALEHAKGRAYDRHVLVIQTDGHENASKEYGVEAVRKLLQEVEGCGWQIVYLGAGIDAFSEMKQFYGTHRAASVQYGRSEAGIAGMTASLSDAVSKYRVRGRAVAEDLTVDESGERATRSPQGPGGRQTDAAADPMSRLKR